MFASLLAGCSASLDERVRLQEQKWWAAGVDDYELTIDQSSVWLEESYTVQVSSGSVELTGYECYPGLIGDYCVDDPAPVDDLDTIGEVFDLASLWAKENDGKNLRIEFESNYGFPIRMSYDDPDLADEESYVAVTVRVPAQ